MEELLLEDNQIDRSFDQNKEPGIIPEETYPIASRQDVSRVDLPCALKSMAAWRGWKDILRDPSDSISPTTGLGLFIFGGRLLNRIFGHLSSSER